MTNASACSVETHQLSEFVGRKPIKQRLAIRVKAAKAQDIPLPHMLFFRLAGHRQDDARRASRQRARLPAAATTGDKLQKREDVWRCSRTARERVRPYEEKLERVPFHKTSRSYLRGRDPGDQPRGGGASVPPAGGRLLADNFGTRRQARLAYWELPPFTLIGATTDAGDLPQPLVDRLKSTSTWSPTRTPRCCASPRRTPQVHRELPRPHLRRRGGFNSFPATDEEALVELARRARSTPASPPHW